MRAFSLFEHVIRRIQPPVINHFFQQRSLPANVNKQKRIVRVKLLDVSKLFGNFFNFEAHNFCFDRTVCKQTKSKEHRVLVFSFLPGSALEDPHQQPRGLHGDLFVEELELELDVENIGLGLLRSFSLEGELSGEQNVQENSQTPDVTLGEGLGFVEDFGS